MRYRPLLAGAVFAALLGSGVSASAKTVCGQFGDPDGRFYVLERVKTKTGSHGPLIGYLVSDAGQRVPFSGHYAVFSGSWILVHAAEGPGSTGFGATTRLRNWEAPIRADVPNSAMYGSAVDGNAVAEIPSTSTSFEDCKNVPKFKTPN